MKRISFISVFVIGFVYLVNFFVVFAQQMPVSGRSAELEQAGAVAGQAQQQIQNVEQQARKRVQKAKKEHAQKVTEQKRREKQERKEKRTQERKLKHEKQKREKEIERRTKAERVKRERAKKEARKKEEKAKREIHKKKDRAQRVAHKELQHVQQSAQAIQAHVQKAEEQINIAKEIHKQVLPVTPEAPRDRMRREKDQARKAQKAIEKAKRHIVKIRKETERAKKRAEVARKAAKDVHPVVHQKTTPLIDHVDKTKKASDDAHTILHAIPVVTKPLVPHEQAQLAQAKNAAQKAREHAQKVIDQSRAITEHMKEVTSQAELQKKMLPSAETKPMPIAAKVGGVAGMKVSEGVPSAKGIVLPCDVANPKTGAECAALVGSVVLAAGGPILGAVIQKMLNKYPLDLKALARLTKAEITEKITQIKNISLEIQGGDLSNVGELVQQFNAFDSGTFTEFYRGQIAQSVLKGRMAAYDMSEELATRYLDRGMVYKILRKSGDDNLLKAASQATDKERIDMFKSFLDEQLKNDFNVEFAHVAGNINQKEMQSFFDSLFEQEPLSTDAQNILNGFYENKILNKTLVPNDLNRLAKEYLNFRFKGEGWSAKEIDVYWELHPRANYVDTLDEDVLAQLMAGWKNALNQPIDFWIDYFIQPRSTLEWNFNQAVDMMKKLDKWDATDEATHWFLRARGKIMAQQPVGKIDDVKDAFRMLAEGKANTSDAAFSNYFDYFVTEKNTLLSRSEMSQYLKSLGYEGETVIKPALAKLPQLYKQEINTLLAGEDFTASQQAAFWDLKPVDMDNILSQGLSLSSYKQYLQTYKEIFARAPENPATFVDWLIDQTSRGDFAWTKVEEILKNVGAWKADETITERFFAQLSGTLTPKVSADVKDALKAMAQGELNTVDDALDYVLKNRFSRGLPKIQEVEAEIGKFGYTDAQLSKLSVGDYADALGSRLSLSPELSSFLKNETKMPLSEWEGVYGNAMQLDKSLNSLSKELSMDRKMLENKLGGNKFFSEQITQGVETETQMAEQFMEKLSAHEWQQLTTEQAASLYKLDPAVKSENKNVANFLRWGEEKGLYPGKASQRALNGFEEKYGNASLTDTEINELGKLRLGQAERFGYQSPKAMMDDYFAGLAKEGSNLGPNELAGNAKQYLMKTGGYTEAELSQFTDGIVVRATNIVDTNQLGRALNAIKEARELRSLSSLETILESHVGEDVYERSGKEFIEKVKLRANVGAETDAMEAFGAAKEAGERAIAQEEGLAEEALIDDELASAAFDGEWLLRILFFFE